MSDVLETIARLGVVPIVEVERPRRVEGVLSALRDGGLPVAEIVLRTPAALEALALAVQGFPDVLVGAGTVRSESEAVQVLAAGARFVASPVTVPGVVARCLSDGVETFPGVYTPTEIQLALDLGAKVLKFFPAETGGGAAYIRSVAAPLPEASFIPTGGITLENLEAYLRAPQVVACGTSAVAPRGLIESGDFTEITTRARAALAVVARVRPHPAP